MRETKKSHLNEVGQGSTVELYRFVPGTNSLIRINMTILNIIFYF